MSGQCSSAEATRVEEGGNDRERCSSVALGNCICIWGAELEMNSILLARKVLLIFESLVPTAVNCFKNGTQLECCSSIFLDNAILLESASSVEASIVLEDACISSML